MVNTDWLIQNVKQILTLSFPFLSPHQELDMLQNCNQH